MCFLFDVAFTPNCILIYHNLYFMVLFRGCFKVSNLCIVGLTFSTLFYMRGCNHLGLMLSFNEYHYSFYGHQMHWTLILKQVLMEITLFVIIYFIVIGYNWTFPIVGDWSCIAYVVSLCPYLLVFRRVGSLNCNQETNCRVYTVLIGISRRGFSLSEPVLRPRMQ